MAIKKENAKKQGSEIEKIKKIMKFNLRKNREAVWVVGGMAGLLIIFFVFYFIFQGIGKFNYEGLTFTKEKFGQLTVYHHYYYFEDNGQVINYNLYLRNDPRKADVNLYKNGTIFFPLAKFAYISVNTTGLEMCDDSSVAVAELAAFLANNKITPKGATPSPEEANASNVEYITCANKRDRTVIMIQAGDENKIDVSANGMCNTITVSDCKILDDVERFIIESIVDAKTEA